MQGTGLLSEGMLESLVLHDVTDQGEARACARQGSDTVRVLDEEAFKSTKGPAAADVLHAHIILFSHVFRVHRSSLVAGAWGAACIEAHAIFHQA